MNLLHSGAQRARMYKRGILYPVRPSKATRQRSKPALLSAELAASLDANGRRIERIREKDSNRGADTPRRGSVRPHHRGDLTQEAAGECGGNGSNSRSGLGPQPARFPQTTARSGKHSTRLTDGVEYRVAHVNNRAALVARRDVQRCPPTGGNQGGSEG